MEYEPQKDGTSEIFLYGNYKYYIYIYMKKEQSAPSKLLFKITLFICPDKKI